jgi:glycosyltransferase involved in cell wall biosynthesis
MVLLNDAVTGVVVTYNSKDLIKTAYESVRNFHPEMKIIIVDGSNKNDSCYAYVKSLESHYTFPFQVEYNIGHGRGMCAGLYYVDTPYVLFFDSDIRMLKSPIISMINMFEKDTFGVGYIEKTGFDGYEFGVHPQHKQEGWVPYLHPYFQLVSVDNYYKFHPYIHHGAPCIFTMVDIYKKGLSDKILKEFNGLGHSSGKGFTWTGMPREYIQHDVAGTRKINKIQKNIEIEGVWER